MGHYDTCREGNCGRCGQALEYCTCTAKEIVGDVGTKDVGEAVTADVKGTVFVFRMVEATSKLWQLLDQFPYYSTQQRDEALKKAEEKCWGTTHTDIMVIDGNRLQVVNHINGG